MEEPTSARPDNSPQITLGSHTRPLEQRTHKTAILPLILSGFALLAGLGAMGLVAWSAANTNREILRLSTELAQLRISLDLYARNGSGAGSVGEEALADLGSRIEALERDALSAAVPLPTPAAELPPVPTTTASGEDCLPAGMRLLVAMGDSYAICGQTAMVDVAMVDNGYITLADGTTIPSGGAMPLPNSACTIGVTSSGDEGLTGYAEIRVTC